jgi:hypothetical protein
VVIILLGVFHDGVEVAVVIADFSSSNSIIFFHSQILFYVLDLQGSYFVRTE